MLVLISDLIEGAFSRQMVQRLVAIREKDVRVVVLPAMTDEGGTQYDQANARAIAALGIPVAECTPEEFHRILERVLNERR